jgi:oligopeptide/dipeptide ABC transporter ATP-binding protein
MTGPPLLEVRDLCVQYALRARRDGTAAVVRAVDGVSFELERGQALGLVGESGCGKSTLARALLGLERAARGSIQLDGIDLLRLDAHSLRRHLRRVGWVAQDPFASLDPRWTVGAIVSEPMAIHAFLKPRERRLRALALLEAVGLDPRRYWNYPHEFSGGQRQRVAIARALALEPDLVVCDEPLSALDVSIQAQVVELLRDLAQRFALAYLIISHDLAVVRHLCSRVAVMYLGKLVEIGRREEVFERPRHPYTQALLSSAPLCDPTAPWRDRDLSLSGEPPSAANPPLGCPFHPRCPRVDQVGAERCARVLPEWKGSSPHAWACHLC